VVVTVTVDEGPIFTLEMLEIKARAISDEEVNQLGGEAFKSDVPVNRAVSRPGDDQGDGTADGDRISESRPTTRSMPSMTKTNGRPDVEVDRVRIQKWGGSTSPASMIESEPEIRKLWTLKTGDPYRKGYAEHFLTEVHERRILDFLEKPIPT